MSSDRPDSLFVLGYSLLGNLSGMTEVQLFGECGKCQRSLLGLGVDHDNELAFLRLTKGLMVNHFYCVLILLLQKAIGFQDYTIKETGYECCNVLEGTSIFYLSFEGTFYGLKTGTFVYKKLINS